MGDEGAVRAACPVACPGSTLGAFALTEPDVGSDAGALRDGGETDGDGWLLSGQKQWVTNGGHAGHILAFARTNPEVEGGDGISAFLLDASHVTVTREEEKLGLNSSSTADLLLENARVDGDRLLGEEGRGFAIALDALDGGRIGIAAQAVGIAQAAYDTARGYAGERKAFGRRLVDHQAIETKLVNMAVEIEAARLLTYRAAWLKEHARPHKAEGAKAKLYASEMARRQTAEAIQVLGGYGYTKEFPVERYYRDAKITEIYEGTSEIQRIVIARSILGRRREPTGSSEPVRLTKIYTRGGDRGETSLGDGSRVSKLHPRVRRTGTSTSSTRSSGGDRVADGASTTSSYGPERAVRRRRRHHRSDEGRAPRTQEQVDRLEADCDSFNAELAPLKSFVLPGGRSSRRGSFSRAPSAGGPSGRCSRQTSACCPPSTSTGFPTCCSSSRAARTSGRRAALEAWKLLVVFAGSFVAGYLGSMIGLVLGTLRLPLVLLASGDPSAGGDEHRHQRCFCRIRRASPQPRGQGRLARRRVDDASVCRRRARRRVLRPSRPRPAALRCHRGRARVERARPPRAAVPGHPRRSRASPPPSSSAG